MTSCLDVMTYMYSRQGPVPFLLNGRATELASHISTVCVLFLFTNLFRFISFWQCERDFHGIYRLHEAVLLLPEAQNVPDGTTN